jgi:hypothetical protein
VQFLMVEGMGAPAEAVAGMRQYAPVWHDLVALAHTLPYDTTIMGDFSLPTEELATLAVPTLVVCGGDAAPWLHNSAQALAGAVAGAKHYTLAGQGTAVDPAVLAPELENFFAN